MKDEYLLKLKENTRYSKELLKQINNNEIEMLTALKLYYYKRGYIANVEEMTNPIYKVFYESELLLKNYIEKTDELIALTNINNSIKEFSKYYIIQQENQNILTL